ncbi:unnamed protein product [Cylindrotheca closterium]|uniref:Ricin B lectin domain-containing protein n=1 Tax=Cylindrotheca closterium TaxID=2856 RepID=A0AAD2FNK0_9STRA|nr:unnamed protein product [Cylindrotheca closterium]
MSEHSASPTSTEKRRLNEDTISSLPRKSFQVTMTGGIMYQGHSCATLATQNSSSDNDESFLDEESRQSMEKLQLSAKRRQEREAQLRLSKFHGEGAMVDPESNCNPMNISADSTMDSSQQGSSVQEFGELVSDDGKKATEEKTICGFTKKQFCFLLVATFIVTLAGASIPTVFVTSKEAIATQAPSVSMVPSAAPSLSMVPSDQPSLVPTNTFQPSSIPSDLPSTVPSIVPTDTYKPSQRPSNVPSLSLVPSSQPTNSMVPSEVPSMVPTDTQSPSRAPTPLPSVEPSLSMEPTFTPIDPNWRFKLRLHWSKDYFWQEETTERFWCLECVPCEEYGRDDGWKHGCESYPDGSNGNCKAGDSVWIRDCRKYGNEYNVLQKHKAGFTLRLHNTNLCIERRNKHLMMKKCNINDPDQQFVAWDDFSKFELRPLEHAGRNEREADCVSQLHHPKSDEVVGMHSCWLCRHFETRYWEIYK